MSELEKLREELNKQIENSLPLQCLVELSQQLDILIVKAQMSAENKEC